MKPGVSKPLEISVDRLAGLELSVKVCCLLIGTGEPGWSFN
jgi:hypothetical protein